MSRLPNGNNPYTNGDRQFDDANQYDSMHQDNRPISVGPEHRVEGYGGFDSGDANLSVPHANDEGISTSTNERFNGVDNGYGSSRHGYAGRNQARWQSTSRDGDGDGLQNNSRTYGNGPGGRQIEGTHRMSPMSLEESLGESKAMFLEAYRVEKSYVLHHISDKWEVMASEECVPVHVALQLMDHTSLGRGRDYQDFQRTSRQLQKALRSIVNEHHQGFNSSIGTFHKIQSSIQASQSRVRSLRESVLNAKSSLMEAKPELHDLGSSSQRYEHMLHILGQIEKLQTVPESLDARIADKHFLGAVDVLQDALRIIRKSEMETIGGLSDLRVYFSNQETSLTDILVEELHDHLYLKAPYCQGRWKSYSSLDKDRGNSADASLPNTWSRPLYTFLNSLDVSAPINDETSTSLQADSFRYIHLLLEALDRLGCLDVAVDRIEQRLPVELFNIVDRTNQEVDLRHPAHLRDIGRLEDAILGHGLLDAKGRSDVLDDLLWTLYSKFEAVAEAHRVVHDVVSGIAKRNGLRRPADLTGTFKELWKLYQSELRSLLHDYLATNESAMSRTGRSASGDSNLLQSNRRDRLKRVFKLAEVDQKSSNFTNEQEELDKILQSSVPGLVSKSQRRSGTHSDKDRVSRGGPATHKLLTESSVFNIAILLPPSLSFLQRLKDIVPNDSDIAISTLTSFLDDFLVNVFLPQLDETVTGLCTESYMDPHAFQGNPHWQRQAAMPILKSTSDFFTLIKTFCRLLDSLPEDQSFTQPILAQLVSYYDRCCGWYKTMVRRVSTNVQGPDELKPAAAMAEAGDLRDVLSSRWASVNSDNGPSIQKEIDYLVSATKESPLVPVDIISDRRTVTSLCLLYNSMQWLANCLLRLRHVVPESQSVKRSSARPQQIRRWTLLELKKPHSKEEPIHLPLSGEAIGTFDGIITSMRALAHDALFILHVDIRCGIAHMMAQILKAPYSLSYPTNTPDPNVLALNSDLLSFDDTVSAYLPRREHRFITAGLAALVDALLVSNASQIQSMNANGCGRMQLNILVLQQNLKAIEGDVSLSRSARFFELFAEGADAILANAKGGDAKDLDFTLDERKAMLELCYSDGLRSTQRESSVLARKKLDEHLRQLEETS